MTSINPNSRYSPFLPTTFDFPDEEEGVSYFVTDNFAAFADVINDKTIGSFTEKTEAFNGEKWSYDTTRKVRNGFNAIARITSFVPQVIPNPIVDVGPQLIMTHVWGTASLPCTAVGAGDGDYFSFYSQGDLRIQFTVSDTIITITTNGTTASYQGFIVLQYLRDGI